MEITESLLASYAKGTCSDEERQFVRCYLIENPKETSKVITLMDDRMDGDRVMDGLKSLVQEILLDKEYIGSMGHVDDEYPLTAMAADNTVDNLCVIRCEGLAMRRFGINISDEALTEDARQNGWLTEYGTMLKNIGRLSEEHGLKVERKLNSDCGIIKDWLEKNRIVIASVDEGELVGDRKLEKLEDEIIGNKPDHVVIIAEYNEKDKTVTIIDPNTPELKDTYPLDIFQDAWDDSNDYLIGIYA